MEGHEPKRPVADTTTAENLKHLASLIDRGVPLSLKINGRRVALPADARFAIDLEREPRSGCVEVDIRWSLPAADGAVKGRKASAHDGSRNTAGQGAGRNPHIRLKALITAPTI